MPVGEGTSSCSRAYFILTMLIPLKYIAYILRTIAASLSKIFSSPESFCRYPYKIYDDCHPNPPVLHCVEAAKIVEEYAPDFLVAVGGGSNIDTTKAIEILLKYPGHDPYDTLFGDVAPARATTEILGTWRMGNSEGNKLVPFISVPTTAGTGSEITGAAVLDREDIDNKAGTTPFVWSD